MISGDERKVRLWWVTTVSHLFHFVSCCSDSWLTLLLHRGQQIYGQHHSPCNRGGQERSPFKSSLKSYTPGKQAATWSHLKTLPEVWELFAPWGRHPLYLFIYLFSTVFSVTISLVLAVHLSQHWHLQIFHLHWLVRLFADLLPEWLRNYLTLFFTKLDR